MPLNNRVAVIGSSILAPIQDDRFSLEEHLYHLAQAALKDAGLRMDDIDGIVCGSNDQFDGRAISVMMGSAPLGGVDRDILSTPSSGEHAFVMGALRVASGLYGTQLVVAWGPTEASSLSEAERLGADPYFTRRLPMDEMATFGLQASAIAAKYPQATDAAPALAGRNRRNGAVAHPGIDVGPTSAAEIAGGKPVGWPITEGMVRPPVGGAVAMVLASEEWVTRSKAQRPAWVRGMGWATEASFLGDRDLTEASALDEAARQAFADAGIEMSGVDVVELTAPSPYQELLVSDRLGIASPGDWARLASSDAKSRWRVNPSGGIASINPVFCGGMMRIAEAANQVRGKAGPHQAEACEVALAHAASGFAMAYQTVVILAAR